MKAIFIKKTGTPRLAFEIRDVAEKPLENDQVRIAVSYSGINFADVMARHGLYREAPPVPFVPGYEVTGIITETGKEVKGLQTGDHVLAFTRFGGYSESVVTPGIAAVKIPAEMDPVHACSLATQGITALYCAGYAANVRHGEKVVIHSAAGGVGSLLIQLCINAGAEVFAVCSPSKHELVKSLGAVRTGNYEMFDEEVKKFWGGCDVVFDPVGGKTFKRGMKLLFPGGRIVSFGASERIGISGWFADLSLVFRSGFIHHLGLLMKARTVAGVNMLKIGDHDPGLIHSLMTRVLALYEKGALRPLDGRTFHYSEVSAAHEYLESRKSTGKVILSWN